MVDNYCCSTKYLTESFVFCLLILLNQFDKRKVFLLCALFLFFPSLVIAQENYSVSTLNLTVFADGAITVEYTLDVDITIPRISFNPIGEIYSNLIIDDGSDNPLDYSSIDGEISIDSLGSDLVNIFYETFDLTNKTGRIWTFAAEIPIDSLITLPETATIISINQVPKAISTIEEKTVLTIPAGDLIISYGIGVLGTREHALTLIIAAETAIDQAKNKDVNVSDFEKLLQDAKTSFDEENYFSAEEIASNVISLIDEQESQSSTISQPDDDEGFSSIILVVVGVLLVVSIGAILFFIRYRRKSNKTSTEFLSQKRWRDIDLEKIFTEKPHLRLEDKEVIKYIVESGGEVFESEIREKFQLPKTTVWRLGKRLVGEGVIEIVTMRGTNLVKIPSKYEGKK